jgi:D-sedoheptulose 7-phosphate isomerase
MDQSSAQAVFNRRRAEHEAVFARLPGLLPDVEKAADLMIDALRRERSILMCGNGGSASDAQHFVTELVGRFIKERRGLPAIALSSTISTITAVGNDYGYGAVFERQVEAFAGHSDVLVAISTSGNSESIVRAARLAREKGLKVVGMTGESGGELKGLCDVCLCAPSSTTAFVQESHIFLIHVLCELIDGVFAPA